MDIKRFSVFAVLLSSSSFSGAAEEESQRSSPYARWAEEQTTNVGGSIPIRIVSQGQLRYAPSLEIEQGSGLVKSGGYVVNEEGVALSANSVRSSLAGETSGQKQKQPKSKETGQNPKPKPKPEVRNPALIAIDQKSDENGFRIHPTSHLKEALIQSPDILPFVIKVKTAYAVLKGRNASFNQYSKLDFDLSKNESVTVEALKGANIISLDQNIIEAEINSLDFTIEAKGFDKVRDLLVKVST